MRGSVGLIVFLLSAPVCSGHCHGNSLPKNVTGLGVICECQDPNSVCYEEVAPASSGCRDPSSVSPFEHWASGDCPKCICVGGPLQNSIDRAGLVVSALGLVGCTYVFMTFVVWKSYREQPKRITMLVLATDAVTAACYVQLMSGKLPGGFAEDGQLTEKGCLSTAFVISAKYTTGLSQLVMVTALNYVVVLRHTQISSRVERGVLIFIACFFGFGVGGAQLQCVKHCVYDQESACKNFDSTIEVGFSAVASLVVVAYTIACVGLVRKWSEVQGLFKSPHEGISNDDGALYPQQTLNRRQRMARDRLAKLKASTFREAVYVYVPYVLGFCVTSVAIFYVSVIHHRIAEIVPDLHEPAYQQEFNRLRGAMYWVRFVGLLQPLLNFLATIIDKTSRKHMDPHGVAMRWRKSRKSKKVVVAGPDKQRFKLHDMIRDYDDSAEDSYDSVSTDDGGDNHHVHQNGDWDVSYAAADGNSDSIAMLSASRAPIVVNLSSHDRRITATEAKV